MRVIAGEFRSRVLKSIGGQHVRPTPDRLRESLFNVIAPRMHDCTFLDAYAGSGAVAIEAISRGARHAILIERSAAAMAVIRENVAALGIAARVTVLRGQARQHLPRHPADFAFIDPPYELTDEYTESLRLLGSGSVADVIAQHPVRLPLEDSYGVLVKSREIRQGDNVLSFYRLSKMPSSEQA